MSTKLPDTTPTWFRLSDEAWAELGRAYLAGATAKALSAQYKVRPKTIYRHAKKNGWQKYRNPLVSMRARELANARGATLPPAKPVHLYAPPPPAGDPTVARKPGPPEPAFTPDPRFWIDRYTAGEFYDPGVTALIAVSASTGAMIAGHLHEAGVLAQIGYLHARIAKLDPQSKRAQIFEALTDVQLCEQMFDLERHDGEAELKHAYWRWRGERNIAAQKSADELAQARRRIAELEAQVAASGARSGLGDHVRDGGQDHGEHAHGADGEPDKGIEVHDGTPSLIAREPDA